MTRLEPELGDSDLCIGQLVPFVQQAIRASGVGCHPAHTETFPTHSVSTVANVARRLARTSTTRRMRDGGWPCQIPANRKGTSSVILLVAGLVEDDERTVRARDRRGKAPDGNPRTRTPRRDRPSGGVE